MSQKDDNHVHKNVTLLQGPLNTHSCFPIGIALHSVQVFHCVSLSRAAVSQSQNVYRGLGLLEGLLLP